MEPRGSRHARRERSHRRMLKERQISQHRVHVANRHGQSGARIRDERRVRREATPAQRRQEHMEHRRQFSHLSNSPPTCTPRQSRRPPSL